jgi:hypothetical protein
MADPRLQALMIEFAGRVAALDPPPELEVYDLVQFQTRNLDVMLLACPVAEGGDAEPTGHRVSTTQFLEGAERATRQAMQRAQPQPQQSQQAQAVKRTIPLTDEDRSIIELVRRDGTVKASVIASRLGYSRTSSHFRARLANLAGQDVLIGTHFGYRLGSNAPQATVAPTGEIAG